MVQKTNLRADLATIIADYRQHDFGGIDEQHVDRWINQFPASVRDPILAELIHVFSHTYYSRTRVEQFIDAKVLDPALVGNNPAAFWQGVDLLNLQTAGNSQRDMIALLKASVTRQCGVQIGSGAGAPQAHLYIDDGLFSGGRIKNDVIPWINGPAPKVANLTVLVIASHAYGEWDIGNKIKKAAAGAGKNINLVFKGAVVFENRKTYLKNADILCPKSVPNDANTAAYAAGLGPGYLLRPSGGASKLGIFSGEPGRHLLEQEFLKQGVLVRGMCTNFDVYMRPLGRILFNSLGFGSTIVTYRNCPNNAPLVLWAGDPWYPLFPRVTN